MHFTSSRPIEIVNLTPHPSTQLTHTKDLIFADPMTHRGRATVPLLRQWLIVYPRWLGVTEVKKYPTQGCIVGGWPRTESKTITAGVQLVQFGFKFIKSYDDV